MAVVYRGWDLRHDRPVALKVLRPELAAGMRVGTGWRPVPRRRRRGPGWQGWWSDDLGAGCRRRKKPPEFPF
jgi:hypothetical protein